MLQKLCPINNEYINFSLGCMHPSIVCLLVVLGTLAPMAPGKSAPVTNFGFRIPSAYEYKDETALRLYFGTHCRVFHVKFLAVFIVMYGISVLSSFMPVPP